MPRGKSSKLKRRLAAIVAQKATGKKRWIVLGVVTALAAIGVAIAVRNAQLSRKSTATWFCSWKVCARRCSLRHEPRARTGIDAR